MSYECLIIMDSGMGNCQLSTLNYPLTTVVRTLKNKLIADETYFNPRSGRSNTGKR